MSARAVLEILKLSYCLINLIDIYSPTPVPVRFQCVFLIDPRYNNHYVLYFVFDSDPSPFDYTYTFFHPLRV